jgi:hypothetical protein
VAGPRSGDRSIAVDEADTRQPMGTQRRRVDVEPRQFVQGSRRERVTAGLVSCDGAFLDDGDVMTCPGEPGGDRRPGRTPADDEDVGVQGGPRSVGRQPADGGEPGMASGPIGVMSAIVGGSGEV